MLLLIASLFILLLAIGLFEFSSNITVDNFRNLTSRLMHRASEASKESLDPAHFLVEVKSRYIRLTTVVVALVAGLYALIAYGIIIHQLPIASATASAGCHNHRNLLRIHRTGLYFIWSLNDTPALYRASFSFSDDNLRQAGPQRIGEDLLQYAMVVVSIVNVQAMVVPVVALLAACSTLAPPMARAQPDPELYALRMRRLKEVPAAASAILVAGILHMEAWLRWPTVRRICSCGT